MLNIGISKAFGLLPFAFGSESGAGSYSANGDRRFYTSQFTPRPR